MNVKDGWSAWHVGIYSEKRISTREIRFFSNAWVNLSQWSNIAETSDRCWSSWQFIDHDCSRSLWSGHSRSAGSPKFRVISRAIPNLKKEITNEKTFRFLESNVSRLDKFHSAYLAITKNTLEKPRRDERGSSLLIAIYLASNTFSFVVLGWRIISIELPSMLLSP